MRQLATDLVSTHETPDVGVGAVYHFGVCSRTNSCRAFGFDSEREFEPREYTDCLILRPAFDSLPTPPPTADENAHDWFIRLVDAQRTLAGNDSAPRIGGELHLTTISTAGLSVQTIHRFDDYESDYAAMLAGVTPP